MHNICRAGGKIRSSVSRFSYQLRTLRVEVPEMKRWGWRGGKGGEGEERKSGRTGGVADRPLRDFLQIAESQVLQEYHVTFPQCHFGN